jgi:hypothetical protein
MIATLEAGAGDHINVKEIDAILIAFQLFSNAWQGHKAVLHTDSFTALWGLRKGYIKGAANMPLGQLLLLAAVRDIDLYPTWLSSKDNALADALSRLDLSRIADICP